MNTRTTDTMSEAIALSSPSGRMSQRARKAAFERLRVALFGADGLQPGLPPQPTGAAKAALLRQRAADLRAMAARGMRPRAFRKEAERLEAEANELPG